jgi:hypothetical protein
MSLWKAQRRRETANKRNERAGLKQITGAFRGEFVETRSTQGMRDQLQIGEDVLDTLR